MLMIKTIMSQVQEEDWFVTIDLKDAYFTSRSFKDRRFLRFAFGGKAYQYKVLPFGLALALRTFTKCMDAALAPLRLQGIRVLNYLDDWLILAHSRELVSRHRDIVLGHIHSLGLRMNAKKSVLLPSQRTVFLGVRLDSVQMQARLAPARIPVFTACLARFRLGHHVSVGTCRRLFTFPRPCPRRSVLKWSLFTLSIPLPLLQVRMKDSTCSAQSGHWSCMWIAPKFGENLPSYWSVLVLVAAGLPRRSREFLTGWEMPFRWRMRCGTFLHLLVFGRILLGA